MLHRIQQYQNSLVSIQMQIAMFAAIETRCGGFRSIVSRLAILCVIIAQEDLNSKFLSSLPPEWNTHVVVWMNKPEVETMSIDDLYNNFKIVEQKVKKSVGASSGAQNLAFMTAPSTSSTNDANTASAQVSTASPNVNAASPQVSTASVSDNAVYAFMVENPNGSNVSTTGLRSIMKYYQRTGKKIFINANNIVGYDKSKVECYNCHKLGYFVKECRAPRSKEGQFRNQDNTRMQENNEDKSSKAKLAKMNEVLFTEEIGVLKREAACKDYEINVLKSEFEKVKQEKDGMDFKINKFDKASKDLDQLLGSQITDKSKKGLGYSAVPPPHPLIYNRPKNPDMSYFGLDEFKEPEFKGYGPENSEQESNVVCDKKLDISKENSDESLVDRYNFKEFDGGYVTFGGGAYGGRTTGTSEDVDNGEPKTVDDAQKQVEDGPNNENAEQERFTDDSSAKMLMILVLVQYASLDGNTGSLKLNVVGPSVNTASSNEHDSPEDMFTMGVSSTLEATHIESFSDEDEPEVDLGNIINSYTVPTTPNTRIHKDHPIDNVIGDVKSSVQTRRMTKPTSEQGFLSDVYEQKTHDTLNTCLYACFLSQIEPTSIAKALSDSSWVKAM
ncbi:putative ribonuclease H-like domain-containing protein [Tanacetum coccineum]|uniref:Ribonuclease H-like domain-containing protein n=1 Tax=Tanacetum coccineum TaxID=301880 RepID=A0ABQ5AUT2_9ASTR